MIIFPFYFIYISSHFSLYLIYVIYIDVDGVWLWLCEMHSCAVVKCKCRKYVYSSTVPTAGTDLRYSYFTSLCSASTLQFVLHTKHTKSYKVYTSTAEKSWLINQLIDRKLVGNHLITEINFNTKTFNCSTFSNVKICCCSLILNVFQVWTVAWTKQTLWRFIYFYKPKNQLINGEHNQQINP